MKKLLSMTILSVSALALSSPAIAAVGCTGTIAGTYTRDDGALLVNGSWRGDWTQICNIKDVWNGIDPQICWGWFAQANTALTEASNVKIQYNDPATTDCATIPTFSNSPAPRYLMSL